METTMQLFDDLKVACADPKRKLMLFDGTAEGRIAVKRLSDTLARATRFEMDDEFTTLCAKAVYLTPQQTATLALQCRPPFETMWIEWDEKVRTLAAPDICGNWREDRPLRIGFLISRNLKYSYPVYDVMVGVSKTYDIETPDLSPVGYLLVPEPEGKILVSPEDAAFKEMLADGRPKADGLYTATAMGWGYLKSLGIVRSTMNELGEEVTISMSSQLAPYLTALTDRCEIIRAGHAGISIANSVRKLAGSGPLKRRRLLNSVIIESTGTFRWLITVLGLMNSYQTVPSTYQMSGGGKSRPLNLRHVPFMEYRRLSVKLPVDKPISALVKPARLSQVRKRAHKVRGHYRRYKTGKRVFVKEHQRGDASLGFVHKEYLVESGLHS